MQLEHENASFRAALRVASAQQQEMQVALALARVPASPPRHPDAPQGGAARPAPHTISGPSRARRATASTAAAEGAPAAVGSEARTRIAQHEAERRALKQEAYLQQLRLLTGGDGARLEGASPSATPPRPLGGVIGGVSSGGLRHGALGGSPAERAHGTRRA